MKLVDIIAFVTVTIFISVIGILKAKLTKPKRDVEGDKLVGSNVSTLSVALAVCSSFISAISLLGYPAEIYYRGAYMYWYCLMYLISFPIIAYVFMPTFYELKLPSLYEYLERRFSFACRILTSVIFLCQTILYTGLVLYAPALALSSAFNISIFLAILITAFLSAIYLSIICSFLLDTHTTLIYVPFPLIPALGLCSLGLTKNQGLVGNGVQFSIFLILAGFCGYSVLAAFMYRYSSVTDKDWFQKRKAWIFVVAIHLFSSIPCLSIFWAMFEFNWEIGHQFIVKNYPDFIPIYGNNCMVCLPDRALTYVFMGSVAISIMLGFSCDYILVYQTFRYLKKHEKSLSKKTLKMQQQLMISLIVQTLVPTITLGLPYLGIVFSSLGATQEINKFSWLIFEISSLHGTLNNIVMITLTPCYRDVWLKPVKMVFDKIKKYIIGNSDGVLIF